MCILRYLNMTPADVRELIMYFYETASERILFHTCVKLVTSQLSTRSAEGITKQLQRRASLLTRCCSAGAVL